MSGRFWPVAEPAQADYERLRTLVLAGEAIDDLLAARRFERRGLSGLVSWPMADPVYLGSVIGASRRPWSGSQDPREAQLADVFGFLLAHEPAQRARAVGQ